MVGTSWRLDEELAAAIPFGLLAVGPLAVAMGRRRRAGAGDGEAVGAVGPPLAGWGQVLARLISGEYVPDAPVGPVGAVLLVGSLVAVIVAILVGLRRPTLLGWTGLLLGLCALVLSGELLGRFLSSMRALAPAVLAAALVIAVRTTTTAGQQTEVPHLTSPVDGAS